MLEMAGNNDIGLQLLTSVSSPFLNIGITLAILSLSGNIPELNTCDNISFFYIFYINFMYLLNVIHLVYFTTRHLFIYLTACSIIFNLNIDYKFYISY